MSSHLELKSLKRRGRPNVLDIVATAQLLGVTPGHWSRVRRGERSSASLLRRYRQLKREQRTQRPANKTKEPIK